MSEFKNYEEGGINAIRLGAGGILEGTGINNTGFVVAINPEDIGLVKPNDILITPLLDNTSDVPKHMNLFVDDVNIAASTITCIFLHYRNYATEMLPEGTPLLILEFSGKLV